MRLRLEAGQKRATVAVRMSKHTNEHLERHIAILENRVEVETQRADYFEALYCRFSRLFQQMDNLVQTAVEINNEDCWQVVVHDCWGDGKLSHRRTYEGDTLQEVLAAMANGEKFKKEAQP
jgi:hypothetical protein